MMNSLGWTSGLAVTATVLTVAFALLAAKFYETTQHKVAVLFLLLLPVFVAADILGSALLVYFKNRNQIFSSLGAYLGVSWMDCWFQLDFPTALIGMTIYTIPYTFIDVLITMGAMMCPTRRRSFDQRRWRSKAMRYFHT